MPKNSQHLRRIALNAQGLSKKQNFGKGLKGTLAATQHLSYIQLDSISVIQRAHHHVLYSRVPGYQPDMANQLLRKGDIFEYWSHAAAYIPMSDFRFSLPYKHAIKNGQVHWYKNPDKKLMRELLARVRSDGPLKSRDLEQRKQGASGWWDWKPAKKALEQLYMEGDLMVCDREGFQKTYDLSERVLPSSVDTRQPTINEYAEHVLARQLLCHGLISLKGLNYHQRKNAELKSQLKQLVKEKLEAKQLTSIKIDTGEEYWARPETLDSRLGRFNTSVKLLSPFDNAVIQRERLASLFKFNYQIECYLPEAKRRYGYFCLPILYGDKFVGRADCKAHRQDSIFEVKALHIEPETIEKGLKEQFIYEFAKAVQEFMSFQGCSHATIAKTEPKSYLAPLRAALDSFS